MVSALAEVKVSDLNFYQGSDNAWMTAGNDISINNANFRVQKSYVDAYPYELNVDDFRYREQASKAKHVTKSVKLHVLKHSDKYYLTTTCYRRPVHLQVGCRRYEERYRVVEHGG